MKRAPMLALVVAVGWGAMIAPSSASGALVWSSKTPGAIAGIHTSDKVVALSFDDGPDLRFSMRVIEILQQRGLHATFFDTGHRATLYPDLVAAEVAAGEEIGNHTFHHVDIRALSTTALAGEIASARRALFAGGGLDDGLFRPPKGLCDARAAETLTALGYRNIGWSIALEHYTMGRGTIRAQVEAMLARIRPGMIILAHDGGRDRTRSVEALPLLLDGLRARGYVIVTVGDLLTRART